METERSQGIFRLGVLVLVIFVGLMGAVLVACYQILTAGLKVTDPGTVAVVFTLIGSIVSQVAALAMQVGNYYYGSSHGSAVKTEKLAERALAPGEAGKPD